MRDFQTMHGSQAQLGTATAPSRLQAARLVAAVAGLGSVGVSVWPPMNHEVEQHITGANLRCAFSSAGAVHVAVRQWLST